MLWKLNLETNGKKLEGVKLRLWELNKNDALRVDR